SSASACKTSAVPLPASRECAPFLRVTRLAVNSRCPLPVASTKIFGRSPAWVPGPVLLLVRVEVGARRLERGRVALPDFVDVDGLAAGRDAEDVEQDA